MIVIELFSGSQILAETFREHGHKVLTVDNEPSFKPDLCADVLQLRKSDFPVEFQHPDVVWASIPCTAFSVCTFSRHWRNGRPISDKARLGLQLLEKTKELIKELNPRYFFIENPRGMMRKQKVIGRRVSLTYCKYGMKYQKPTDIFTNSTYQGRKPCKAGDRCHEFQPRTYRRKVGFKVLGLGIQGLANAFERGKLPKELCQEIVAYCEGNFKQLSMKEWED